MTERADGGVDSGYDETTEVTERVKKPRARGVYMEPTDKPADSASALARVMHTKLMAKGWSQKDLLDAMNNKRPANMKAIGRWTVNSYYRGISMPRPRILQLMADAFGCKVTDLVSTSSDVVVHSDKQQPANIQMGSNGRGRIKLDMDLPSDVILKILSLVSEATV